MDINIVFTVMAFLILTFSLVRNRMLVLSFLVFFEYVASNSILEALTENVTDDKAAFFVVHAIQGGFYIGFATLILALFMATPKSDKIKGVRLMGGKSSLIVGFIYYAIGIFELGLIIESIKIDGMIGYPLEYFGLYGKIVDFYASVSVLILTTMVFSLGNKNGRIIRGIGNLRNLINFGNKANPTYRQGCNHITNSKRG